MLPLERYLVGRGRLYVCAYLLKKAQQHFCVSVEHKYLRLTQWCVAGRLWRRRSRRTLAPGLILFISLRLRSTSSAKSPVGNSLWVELHFFFLLDLSLLSLLEVKMHWRISLAVFGSNVFLLCSLSIAPLMLVGYHSLFITFGPEPGSSWSGEEGEGTASCLQSQCLG